MGGEVRKGRWRWSVCEEEEKEEMKKKNERKDRIGLRLLVVKAVES